MHTTRKFLTVLVLMALVEAGPIGAETGNLTSLEAVTCETPPKIDGDIQAGEWIEAETIQGLTQVEPTYGSSASHQTLVYIMYDRNNLYVAAFCYDTAGNYRIAEMTRDYTFVQNEGFGVVLDPLLTKRDAVGFFTTPSGAQLDVQSFDATIFDNDWNAIWEVSTSTCDSGWSCEFAIPWQSLRYKSETDRIGVNFLRLSRLTNETSTWILYPRLHSVYRMDYAGILENLQLPSNRTNILATPYSLLKKQHILGESDDFDWLNGADLRWTANPHTVLELTYNTDFAQAEVDRHVINLNRFDYQFPERRQFFLENSGLFRTTGNNSLLQPFFSRRIGLDDLGTPEKILFGSRFQMKGSKNNIGLLAVETESTDSKSNSRFLVSRYSRNYGAQNRNGFLGTMRDNSGPQISDRNYTGGIDGFNRLTTVFSTSYSVNGSWTAVEGESRTSNGYAGEVGLNYIRDNINVFADQTFISREFRAETGFVGWSNVLASDAGFDLFLRPAWKPHWIRDFEPALYVNFYHRLSDRKHYGTELTVWPLYVRMESGGVAYFIWYPTWQNLDEPFSPTTGITIAADNYHYNRFHAKFATDPSASIGVGLSVIWGTFYDGNLTTTESNLFWRPRPQMSLTGSTNLNWFRSVGDAPGVTRADIYSGTLAVTPTPRLGLALFYQYNTDTKTPALQARLSWEYNPLSMIYLVFNSGKVTTYDQGNVDYENGLIKITYAYQL